MSTRDDILAGVEADVRRVVGAVGLSMVVHQATVHTVMRLLSKRLGPLVEAGSELRKEIGTDAGARWDNAVKQGTRL